MLAFFVLSLCIALSEANLVGLSGPTVGLVFIDPVSGNVTKHGMQITTDLVAEGESVVVGTNYWFLAETRSNPPKVIVSAINIVTGKLVPGSTVDTPFAPEMLVGVGSYVDYDPLAHALLLGGPTTTKGEHLLAKFDLVTHKFDTITTLKGVDVLGGVHGFNPSSRQWYVQYATITNKTAQINFVAVNVDTGHKFIFDDSTAMESATYDSVTKSLIGFGLEQSSTAGKYQRTIVSISADHKQTKLASLPFEWWVINGGLSAWDPVRRVLMGFLSKRSNFHQMYLVQADLSGKVVASPKLPLSTPWSIQYVK